VRATEVDTAANYVLRWAVLTVDRDQSRADRQVLSHLRQELQQAVVLLSKLHQPPTVDPENYTELAASAIVSLRFQPYESWVLIHVRRCGRQIACGEGSLPG
jgi:hypothetical protein